MNPQTSEYRSDILEYHTLGKRQLDGATVSIPQDVIIGVIVGCVIFFVVFIVGLITWIWYHYKPSKKTGHRSDIESAYGSARFSNETLIPRLSDQDSLSEKKEDGITLHDRQIPSRTTSDDTMTSNMVTATPVVSPLQNRPTSLELPRPAAFPETLRTQTRTPNLLSRRSSADRPLSTDSGLLGEAVAMRMSPVSPKVHDFTR